MANTIRLKSGSGSNPSASDLVVGEVALRTDGNPKLFTKNDAGNVLEVGLDSLNDKLPLTGGTITGNLILDNATNAGRDVQWQHANDRLAFFDNTKATFGNGADLEIKHTGSDSRIINSGSDLFIYTVGDHDVKILADSQNAVICKPDAAVELYYDNSKKLETTSTGIKITSNSGDISVVTDSTGSALSLINPQNVNNSDVKFGSNYGNFSIFTGGSSGSEKFAVRHDGNIQIPNDNARLKIGAGQDLQLYHNGNDSFVRDLGTGGLYMTGSVVGIRNSAANEDGLLFAENAAVQLFYDNTKKFETTSGGISITGDITGTGHLDLGDDAKLKMGASDDLEIFHSGGNSFIANSTGYLLVNSEAGDNVIRASNDVYLQPAAGEFGVKATANGATELYYDNSKKFETNSTGVEVIGDILLTFANGYSLFADKSGNFLRLGDSVKLQVGNTGDLEIYHDGATSYISNITGDLRLISDSNLILRSADQSENYLVATRNSDVELYFDGSKKFETTSTGVTVTSNVRIPDGGKYFLGTGDDMYLNHSGSHGAIHNTSGNLYISTHFGIFLSTSLNESAISANANGSVELYYDNSKKFETSSTGATVTGTLTATTFSGSGASLTNIPAGQLTGTLPALDGSNLTGLTVNNANTLDNLDSTQFLRSDAADTASGDITFTDNTKAKFGTGNDLEIYHNGSNSYIDNTTGNLYFRGSNGQMLFRPNNNEDALVLKPNGAVELYYDNAKKLETTANGLYITGAAVFPDGSSNGIQIGNSSDLQIYHDGSKSVIADTGTGGLFIAGSSISLTDAGITETMLYAVPNGAVNLYYDNSLKLYTMSSGVIVSGDLLSSSNVKVNDNGNLIAGSGNDLQIYHNGTHSYIENATGGLYIKVGNGEFLSRNGNEVIAKFLENAAVELYYDNSKKLQTDSDGVEIFGNRLRLADNVKAAFGSGADLQIYHDGSNSYIQDTDQGNLFIEASAVLIRKNGTTENIAKFIQDGAVELYYDNSKKLNTNTNGVHITDTLTFANTGDSVLLADNQNVSCGNGGDLKIFHDGTSSRIHNATGNLTIKSNSILGLYTYTGTEAMAKFTANGAVELYYDNSKKFETTSGGVDVTGSVDTTGNLTITKSSPALNLNYTGTSPGNYPIINFDTNNAQGCALYMTEFDSELPVSGMGLVVKRSDSNTQPSSATLSFSVLGEIYAGSQTLGSCKEVPHSGKSFIPSANNTYDLGSTSYRWRNIYTNDLNLSNEGGSNDVDGTWGSYTIQEGAEDLFLVNKRNGKKYKFNLTEVK